MIFNDRFKNVLMPTILVHSEPLKRVSNFKYLGCILIDDLYEGADMERAMLAFNKSFGIFFRKFYALDVEPFLNLFQSFCTSFYGADLWVNRIKSLNVFKKLSVSYFIASKKIVGCTKYFSNHLVCNFLSTMTFEHFINVKCFKFFRRLCINNSSCFNRVQPYFKRHSNFRIFLENIFLNKYDVRDILENDFDAILARVSFIQNREPSSFYVPHYFMNQLLLITTLCLF